MKFLDDTWFSQYEKTLRESFDEAHTPTKASAKVLEIYKNVPGEGDVWLSIDWEEGVLVDFSHGTDLKSMPRDADFRMEAEYETWLGILSRREDMTADLKTGRFRFYGNISKFQPVLKPYLGAILMQGMVGADGTVQWSDMVQANAVAAMHNF